MTRQRTQACHFRDLTAEFAKYGAQPVGISKDPPDRQRRFSDLHGFGYPLLSDPDGNVASELGARRRLSPETLSTKRMTFVIDTDQRILDVIHSEVNMNRHADNALRVLHNRSPH